MEISLHVPDLLNITEFDVRMSCAAKLYEDRRICLGHGADIAGLSKRAFIEMLGKYGVSACNLTADEIKQDIENAERYFN